MMANSKQFILDINNEIIVDNFSGGGGASTGIELALGRHVDVAINHNPKALEMHEINHPQTKHYCENVWEVDPRDVMPDRFVGLLWLSPDCKHFSKAKGGKPVDKKIRGLAWVALRWAAIRSPRVIILENVEEFLTWGPIGKDGKPCKKNKGREFNAFVNALKRHGYDVEWKELRACDYGAPTIRKRLFLIARRDGKSIIWPEPSHIDPNKPNPKRLKAWRTAAECIDWTLPCQSIFERKKSLAENTLRRIAKGIQRYVIDAAEPYIVTMSHGEGEGKTKRWGSGVRSKDLPLPTITASGGYGLAVPFISEHANASNQRNMPGDEPLRTQCAQVKGGHFSLVSALLAKHYTGAVGSGMKEPVSTVTGIDHNSLVTTNMLKMRGSNIGSAASEPLHTISAGGTHHAEVRAFLLKYYGTDQDPKLNHPLHTITTKERFGLVVVRGELYKIVDIGLRMLQPRELFRAQGFGDDYIIGDDELQGLKLTKKEQVQMVGNSVSPVLAKALVESNCLDLKVSTCEEDLLYG